MSNFTIHSMKDVQRVPDILQQYGFAVIEGVFGVEEVAELKQEMGNIVNELDVEQHPKSIFTTTDEDRVSESTRMSCVFNIV